MENDAIFMRGNTVVVHRKQLDELNKTIDGIKVVG